MLPVVAVGPLQWAAPYAKLADFNSIPATGFVRHLISKFNEQYCKQGRSAYQNQLKAGKFWRADLGRESGLGISGAHEHPCEGTDAPPHA